MAVLPIITLGHPSLRKKAEKVVRFDAELKDLVDNMIVTMQVNEGIGLAATQLNIMKQIFVIDRSLLDEELQPQAYINPEILEADGDDRHEEGCLSIPGIRADVDRPFTIKVRYQDLKGNTTEESIEGLYARVFQHEND
ncbi:MAG: peptide deformylase, partial [Calditrichia bacterium]